MTEPSHKYVNDRTIRWNATNTSNSGEADCAEHSWHLALMVILLAEHADEPVDVGHTVKLVVVHDLVEIYAGDTPLYDDEGALDQEDRERAAADRLFGLLPADQARDAVRARKAHIGAASAPLGATARLIIDEGERRGWVRSGEHTGGDRSAAPPA